MKLIKQIGDGAYQVIHINEFTNWTYCEQHLPGHDTTLVWEGYLVLDPFTLQYTTTTDPEASNDSMSDDQDLLIYVGQLQREGWRYTL